MSTASIHPGNAISEWVNGNMSSATFNPNVHGARGAFSLAVFIYHVTHSGLPTIAGVNGSWFESYVLFAGMFGVELFFGISGIVIVGALRKAPSTSAFLWDRVTRIYPVLWATIIVISSISLMSGDPKHILQSKWSWGLNFIAPPPFVSANLANPAAWSLGYELTFYALCAAGWSLRARGVRWWLVPTAMVGGILLACYPRGILMVAGVLIACGLTERPWIERWSRMPFVSLIIFLITWRGLFQTPSYAEPDLPSVLTMPFGDWLVVAPLMLLSSGFGLLALHGIAKGYGAAGRIFKSRIMMGLGTISYSFYLWQPAVMAIVKRVIYATHIAEMPGLMPQLTLGLVALPITLGIAILSERILEKRLTRILRRLGPGGRRAHAPVTTLAA